MTAPKKKWDVEATMLLEVDASTEEEAMEIAKKNDPSGDGWEAFQVHNATLTSGQDFGLISQD